jgi:hypothetical protein
VKIKMKKLKKSTTDLMGVSIGGMAGLGALGAMGNIPGMPVQAQGVIPMAATGVKLAQIGGIFNIAKNVVSDSKSKNKCKKKYKR